MQYEENRRLVTKWINTIAVRFLKKLVLRPRKPIYKKWYDIFLFSFNSITFELSFEFLN